MKKKMDPEKCHMDIWESPYETGGIEPLHLSESLSADTSLPPFSGEMSCLGWRSL